MSRTTLAARLRPVALALGLFAGWPVAGQMPPAPGGAAELGATLRGLLEHARAANPELRVMRLEADAAAERAAAAGALRDPMLEVELRDVTNEMAGGGFNLLPANVGSTKYTVSQTLPAWGSRQARRDAAAAGADAAARLADAAWTEVATRIKTSYARYQQVTEALAQSRELLGVIDRLEAVAQSRYAAGLAAQQDAIRAQVERTTLLTEIALLEAELPALRARLNGLLARAPDAPLAAPRPAPALPPIAALDEAALGDRALARNPQLAAEGARVRAAEGNRDVVYSNRYPEFGIGISPVQRGSRIAEWELRFGINLPLQQGSRRAEEREALAMLAAAEARRESLRNEILAQLGEARAAYAAARRIETLTAVSLLPQAEVTLASALAGYESGRVDFATVLDAQRQIRQARLSLIRAGTEARIRLAEIERLLGEDL